MLSLAGRPATIPLGRLLAAKPALGLAGLGVGLLLSALGEAPTLKLTGLFVVFVGYFIPDLLLLSKGQDRQKAIQLELANTMDQMLISVEAGLGFEGAMARAGENGKGPLAEELVRTLQDMHVGRSRRESYLGLADRTSVPELRSFVQAVVQADTYGIAISRVLRVQAKVMRVKRRQRAEEKAMKLPVMVLFPLLFFIFPVLFIVILGPAVINAIASFSGQ
jgi:tight adherence protein C